MAPPTTPPTASFSLVATIALTIPSACGKSAPPTTPPTTEPSAEAAPAADPLAGKPVVLNVDAQPGDVTTCPFSGKRFVVKAEHPTVEYEGKRYTICSEKAAESVRADPGKYLDDFSG